MLQFRNSHKIPMIVCCLVLLLPACANRSPETGAGSELGVGAGSDSATGAAASGSATGAGGSGSATGAGGSGSATGAPKTAAVYDSGASASEIVFGAVCSNSGIANWQMCRGTQAYFKYINSKGGVNGRKLILKVYDDQADPVRNAALTRQALDQDHVFAFVNNFAPISDHGGQPYIDQHNVPVIGGDGINLRTWNHDPLYYPQQVLLSTVMSRVMGRAAVDAGCKRIAAVGLSVAEGRAWTDGFRQGMRDRGVDDYVYYAEASLAEQNYTVYMARAKQAGATCLTNTGSESMHKDARSVDYHPKFVLPSPGYSPDAFNYLPDSQGDLIGLEIPPLEDAAQRPALKQAIDAINQFEPGALDPKNGTPQTWTVLSWVSGQIAVAAVQRMGDELTRANLVKTLDSMKNFDTGITPPFTYKPGPHVGNNCLYLVEVGNRAWKVNNSNLCL